MMFDGKRLKGELGGWFGAEIEVCYWHMSELSDQGGAGIW